MTAVSISRAVPLPYPTLRPHLARVSIYGDSTEDGVFAMLRAQVGDTDVRRLARVELGPVADAPSPLRAATVPIALEAAVRARLFPRFEGDIELTATDAASSELALVGRYEPPVGALGTVFDHSALYGVALDTLSEYLSDVVSRLMARSAPERRELSD